MLGYAVNRQLQYISPIPLQNCLPAHQNLGHQKDTLFTPLGPAEGPTGGTVHTHRGTLLRHSEKLGRIAATPRR